MAVSSPGLAWSVSKEKVRDLVISIAGSQHQFPGINPDELKRYRPVAGLYYRLGNHNTGLGNFARVLMIPTLSEHFKAKRLLVTENYGNVYDPINDHAERAIMELESEEKRQQLLTILQLARELAGRIREANLSIALGPQNTVNYRIHHIKLAKFCPNS